MKTPQFTLRQLAIAIAAVAALLALSMQATSTLILIALTLLILLMGVGIHRLARLPFRLRLSIEVVTLLALLCLSAWIWRPAFYVEQADRCASLERIASMRAETSDDPQSRSSLNRQAAWFARESSTLRWRALWRGLIEGPSVRQGDPLNDRDLIHELGILERIDRHETEMREDAARPPSRSNGP